ncbi:hypothetical protein AAC387_Pa11g0996 [Persea americana]
MPREKRAKRARQIAAALRPHGWKKLDSGIKLAVITAVKQFFDIGDYEGDMQLRTDIDRQCGVLYRSWKYELHTHYLELLEQGVPRPQDHPAEGCGLADWQLMVSQCWESPTWKAKSKKAQESRAKLPYNHTSGSRSFASRMSLMRAQNAGQAPPITQFFHDTHYRQTSNEWVNEVARQRHEALVQRTEEQSQPSVTTPMTEEQIAADVLGKRSGYVKGYGIYARTSSSSPQSRTPDPEVTALREQLAEQAARQAEQDRRQAEQDRRQAEQDRRQAEQDRRTHALEALIQQLAAAAGIDPSSYFDITRGTTSAGDGTATRDHDATLWDEEADLILRKIYPPHEVETEIQDLKNSVESEIREEGSSEKINLIKLLKTKTVRRGLIAGVGLQVFQQFVGINTVMYYSPTIVQFAGFASNQIALLLSLITSGLNAMGSIVSIYFIDRTGRKKLDKYFLYYFHCFWLDQSD